MSTIKVDTIQTRAGASEISITTLKADTIKGASSAGSMSVVGEGGSTTTNLQQGLAKVWASYPGAAGSINDSFNVSSLTDIDIGNSQMNFSNNMSNIYYSIHSTQQLAASGGTGIFYGNVFGYGTTKCGMSHFENGSVVDPTRYHGTITGDLA